MEKLVDRERRNCFLPHCGTDRIDDLLAFIHENAGDDKDTLSILHTSFERFIRDANPLLVGTQSANTARMEVDYKAQMLADTISGVGVIYGNTGMLNASFMKNNSTPGAELTYEPVRPTIQPSSLTSMDRCRQVLSQVRRVFQHDILALSFLFLNRFCA